jgi:hypothetical protein
MLYNVECPDVMTLEIPSCYTGYEKIEHKPFEDDINIKKILKKEVDRVNNEGTYEAILYCVDRKVVDGHKRVLKSLVNDLNCIVNTYNSNGIYTYIRDVLINDFEDELNKYEIKFTKKECYHPEGGNGSFYEIKNISIRKFYTIAKEIGENCVVTIGKDLICRGISYVGEEQIEPITATTMFYKPGKSMNAVGICQTIGRITGCAMHELKRTLYAPQNVYNDYIKYNKNQEIYIKGFKKSTENIKTKDIMKEMVFNSYKRNIDRRKLKIKMNMTTNQKLKQNVNDNKMNKKIDRWWVSDDIYGKVLRFIYNNGHNVDQKILKEMIKQYGSNSVDRYYDNLFHRNHENIYIRDGNIIKLSEKARCYIQNKI